ncbi:uroporphyrinogen-III synthase [Pacificibacter marinus]|uniref:uroporphyrinogen-III synthase n=1 Tax=Pacificibacter marinus TaxID=658057 RepID=UPI001C07337B|nr:uroporphyrinogen-III synthase [Pacificibacter marinus]
MLGIILPRITLISRPMEDAKALKRALLLMNPSIKIILAPALEIVPIAYDLKTDVFDAIILTSKHAVPAAAKITSMTPILCVGDTTAQTARTFGLRAVSAAGNAKDLIELVQASGATKVLYLRGAHVQADMEFELSLAGIETKSVVVYRQDSCEFSHEIQQSLLAATDLLVPVYSARSARIVSENLNGFAGDITLIAISETAANGWSGPVPHHTVYAKSPNFEAMVAAIASQLA